jgi:hypothetical protein
MLKPWTLLPPVNQVDDIPPEAAVLGLGARP